MRNANDNAPAPAPGHVDQIRDILFGGQMRDYEQRFIQLSETFAQQTQRLREELEARANLLSENGSKGFEAVTAQLKAEKAERVESDRELVRELKEISKNLERGLAQTREHAERLQKETLRQLTEQVKTLREETRAVHGELAALIESEVASLQSAKTDRVTLGVLLGEMAARLTAHDSQPKGK